MLPGVASATLKDRYYAIPEKYATVYSFECARNRKTEIICDWEHALPEYL